MSKKLLLVDGHSILNRAFYGLPDLTNAKGVHTNAVLGFLNIIFKVIEEESPDALAVAFDVHAPTFRHEMYDAYKGTRKPMPPELREQVPLIKEVLHAMQICTVEQAGLEADDILGTLAKKAEKEGYEVALLSGDRDLLQIASDHIKIRIPKTKMGRTEIYDYYAADVQQEYGMTPLQFIELKALMGDTADNIPGVPKVGEKTATDLIVRFGSVAGVYEHLDEVTGKAIHASLEEHRDLAELSLKLATICIDCELDVTLSDLAVTDFYTPQAYTLFQELEFKKLLSRFEQPKETVQIPVTECASVSALEEVLAKATKRIYFRIHTEEVLHRTIEVSEAYENVLAVTLCVSSDQVCHLQIGEDAITLKDFAEALLSCASRGVLLCSFDMKHAYQTLLMGLCEDVLSAPKDFVTDADRIKALCEADEKLSQLTEHAQLFDALIAAYLINPLKNDYTEEDVIKEYLGQFPSEFTQVFGKSTQREALQLQKEAYLNFICAQARSLFETLPQLQQALKDSAQENLFYEIEMPLSLVLYHMEQEGVLVRPEELKAYSEQLSGRIAVLESDIKAQAGCEFNLNSPKQLGEVLFEKLQIPGGKKTKTGYSTSAEVLEKLAPEYPIIDQILEYRGLAKLKSTYADGLIGYVDAGNRIHSTFHQTITATGRISSADPNLQNIPMRTQLGRELRKVFVAKEGFALMDADYSQIELRVLASLSGDEELIRAYNEDADIHRMTASKVFHVPFEEVTDLQRRNAKAVNFGIVYGISSFGLSQDLSISRKEAEGYIASYFAMFPGIKAFLDNAVTQAKEQHYTVTMFGRRRPMPELESSNFMQRSFGERVAKNAPIQGTAADIIKIAMIRVDQRLRREKLRSRLILQVHDELLIETANDERAQVEQILTEEMLHAADLAAPLQIDLHVGENWYEAH